MNVFPLSPVDYIFTGVGSQPISFAFSYNKKLDPDLLKKTLNETLNYFPILRSQLVKISKTDYEFHISEEGLTFDVLQSNTAFEESRNIEKYIIPVSSIEGKPLTKIALTQTPKGSILAVSVSHALADGFSYFHFFSSWARIYKGESIIKPNLQRDVLLSHFNRGEKITTSNDIYTNCGLFHGGKRHQLQNEPVHVERFFISKDTIRSILEDRKNEPEISLTENDIITALLWQKYIPMWSKENKNQKTYVTCPFDIRRVLRGLPRNYFGCALSFATASIHLNGLLEASVRDLAILVRNSVKKVKNDYILSSLATLETLRKQKGLDAMEEIHLRHPHHGIIITNLTRLPIQYLDFGSGAPTDFLSYVDVLGSAAIFPAENGVEIFVAYPPEGR
jgi:shikimate O-hydroxycinnamoyltransferase